MSEDNGEAHARARALLAASALTLLVACGSATPEREAAASGTSLAGTSPPAPSGTSTGTGTATESATTASPSQTQTQTSPGTETDSPTEASLPRLEIAEVRLLPAGSGGPGLGQTCTALVTVRNLGADTANGVEVSGTFRVYDLSNTTFPFDVADFGGAMDIAEGQEATFEAGSVTADAGVSVTYTAAAAVGGTVLDSVPDLPVDGVPIITCEPS